MMNSTLRLLLTICFMISVWENVMAEPNPNDVFREYLYTNTGGDAGGALRVGGKKGVSYPDRGSDFDYINQWVSFPHPLDLEQATRAEVVVEKILSHNGTHGLAIQWNDSDWIDLPAPKQIPEPRRDYYHHTCISAEVDLANLVADDAAGRSGDAVNQFRLRVSPDQDWGWPQHLIYGVHLRIYYEPANKEHVTGRILTPTADSVVGLEVPLAVEILDRQRHVERVDYVGLYDGVNWEGDGIHRRWHYFFYHGQLTHHLGTSTVFPYRCSWDTSWVPDQSEPISLAARIVDDTGLITMTDAVSGVQLHRDGISVELCRPEQVPTNWVTRNQAYEESVTIKGNLTRATAARLAWSSWSPGYMNGITVNGVKVLDHEGPRYRYYAHSVDLPDVSILRSGKNTIGTGKTPLYDGKMVHGMEVNWPGIQLLVRYRTAKRSLDH
ncbi:hypothetical protein [Novipirellula artificiosorum]|uniref:Uncharacterized protein n=1 Tax=Novipirellula artificiosorum TaxID=2528016 RepID=A0A5C6D136_9BACT|nr:hypothetical protein [Novipirellula artificiosorum]TWU30590.1 hypothetical protein Poly41_66850 [Novipirellula artificiosorum]